MLANLRGRVKQLFNHRIHIVIAGRTIVLRPLHWRLALVVGLVAGLFLGSWWWLGRPAQEAEAFKAVLPGKNIHEQITREALRSLGLVDSQIDIINAANRLTDVPYAGLDAFPWVHLDNSQFSAGSQWINDQWERAVDFADSCDTHAEALTSFGLLLHTVQDFYAHSNFIELGGIPPLGAGFETMSNNTPLTAIVKGKTVKTGYYGGKIGANTRNPACRSQAAIKDTVTQCYHGDLNKDTASSPQGRRFFTRAREYAVIETRTQWLRFEQKIRERYPMDADLIIARLKKGCWEYDVVVTPSQPEYQACTTGVFTVKIYQANTAPPKLVALASDERIEATFNGMKVNLVRTGTGTYTYTPPAAIFRNAGDHTLNVKIIRSPWYWFESQVGAGAGTMVVKLPS